jgi:hypothetical protein
VDCEILYNEEFYDYRHYKLPTVVRIIKSMWLRQADYVVRMGIKTYIPNFVWETS